MTLTDAQFDQIREQVFGPCTIACEAKTAPELREDLDDYMTDEVGRKHRSLTSDIERWLREMLDYECYDRYEAPLNQAWDGPTEEEANKLEAQEAAFRKEVNDRIATFINSLKSNN